jgi:hypothetical protein
MESLKRFIESNPWVALIMAVMATFLGVTLLGGQGGEVLPPPTGIPPATATLGPGETPAPTVTEAPPVDTAAPSPTDDGNYFDNPGFEGQCIDRVNAYPELPEADRPHASICSVAGWMPFFAYEGYTPETPAVKHLREGFRDFYKLPEFTRGDRYMDAILPGERVLQGEYSAKSFCFGGECAGGYWQHVNGLTPSACYEVNIYAMAWVSEDDNPASITHDELYRDAVTIWIETDRVGANFAYASSNDVSWQYGFRTTYDRWGLIRFQFEALNDSVNVYLHYQNDYSPKHADVFFDKANLFEISCNEFFPYADPGR